MTKVLKTLATIRIIQSLYVPVNGAMIRGRYYYVLPFNGSVEVVDPSPDSPKTTLQWPTLTTDSDLAPISLPSTSQTVPTATTNQQETDFPILITPTINNPPMLITPPPAAPLNFGTESNSHYSCTPWPWGCDIYYPVCQPSDPVACLTGLEYQSSLLSLPGRNSDCLNTLFPETSATSTIGGSMPFWNSSSVVLVFPTIRATDGCQPIGPTLTDITQTFNTKDVSSIRQDDPTAYSFNMMDFPCPPASVSYTKSGAYRPMILPPLSFLTNLDNAWHTCTPAWGQGIDPPTAERTATEGSNVHDGGNPEIVCC